MIGTGIDLSTEARVDTREGGAFTDVTLDVLLEAPPVVEVIDVMLVGCPGLLLLTIFRAGTGRGGLYVLIFEVLGVDRKLSLLFLGKRCGVGGFSGLRFKIGIVGLAFTVLGAVTSQRLCSIIPLFIPKNLQGESRRSVGDVTLSSASILTGTYCSSSLMVSTTLLLIPETRWRIRYVP